MTNILILGAGFGGINSALKLSRLLRNRGSSIPSESGEKKLRRDFSTSGGPATGWKITLIDRNHFHLFTPSLYEVATVYGLIEDGFTQYLRGSVCIPYGEILRSKRVNFIQAEVKEINLKEKFVSTLGGANLSFDYLVIALGGETEFYNLPGAQDYAFNFKGVDDAIAIYKKIKEVYENYQKEKKGSPIKIGIIGGGFTGVELAAELGCCVVNIIKACKLDKECTQISLFEAGPAILPAINEKQRKIIEKRLKKLGIEIQINSAVVEVGPDFIKLKDRGEVQNFDLVIWAGGVRGSRLLESLNLKLTKKNTIEVNDFLQVKNSGDLVNPKIFAIGDSTALVDPKTQKPIPAMAYVAHDQAEIAARNIINHIYNRELRPYKPFYEAWIAPVGGKWTYFYYKGLGLAGFMGYLLRQLVDLRYFLKILPFNRALALFFKDLVIFTRND